MKPVIAIVGTGALGSYYGGRLAQHGLPVHFLMRSGLAAAKERGLVVHSVDGDFVIPPAQLHLYELAEQMPKADLVIITLKTTANPSFRQLLTPLVKENTQILTLQNGLGNEELLAELFGADRIIGGVAFVCINRMADFSIHHMDHGQIKIADFRGNSGRRARDIAALLTASGIRCVALDDLRQTRWEKLVWNVPFNGLGAVMDKTTDLLIATPGGRELVKSLMNEVIQTASKLGVSLPPDIAQQKIEATKSMGSYRTSMQIDRQEGRPMEIEAILHKPLLAAQSCGVLTPYLATLYQMAAICDG